MKKLSFALQCVVLCMLMPLAGWCQEVYRCDSRYSAALCDAGAAVNAHDKRSKEQKLETDKSTRKISIQANAMEKARLKDETALVAQLKRAEKQALKSQKAADKAKKAQEKADAKKAADDAVRLYKPKVFVAREAKAPN